EEAVGAIPRNEHQLHPGSDRAGQLGSEADAGGSDLGQVVTSQPEPATPTPVTGVAREHHHAASHAPHLAQAGNRVLPVMNVGKSLAASKDWSSNGRLSALAATHRLRDAAHA